MIILRWFCEQKSNEFFLYQRERNTQDPWVRTPAGIQIAINILADETCEKHGQLGTSLFYMFSSQKSKMKQRPIYLFVC